VTLRQDSNAYWCIITTCSELWKVVFLALSVCDFLFVYEISWVQKQFLEQFMVIVAVLG